MEQGLSADWNSHSLYLLHAQVCRLALAVLIAESLLLPPHPFTRPPTPHPTTTTPPVRFPVTHIPSQRQVPVWSSLEDSSFNLRAGRGRAETGWGWGGRQLKPS